MRASYNEFSSPIKMRKIIIDYLIDRYDYEALTQYLQHENIMNDNLLPLLNLGKAIITIDVPASTEIAKNLKLTPLTQATTLEKETYFFLEVMSIKSKQYAFGDYFRALTPLLVHLLRLIVEHQLIPNLNQYIHPVFKENHGGRRIYRGLRWRQDRIENDYNLIHQTFKKYYGKRFNYDHYISSSHLTKIIDDHIVDKKIRDNAAIMRHVEKYIRNIAAHEIIHIDKKLIYQRSGYRFEEIERKLSALADAADLTDQWMRHILTEINQEILKIIRTENN